MTKEYALKQIKGFPLDMRDAAKDDIDRRAYKTAEVVPIFELWGNCYQMSVYYKFRLPDGKELFGKAANISAFTEMHEIAARGESFKVTYLENSGIILEIEETGEIDRSFDFSDKP